MQNITEAQLVHDAYRLAQEAMDAACKALAESRAETGRLQRLYNVAKRRRDGACRTWLDLADTIDVREQIGLDIEYRKQREAGRAGAKAYPEVVNVH